MSVYQIDNAITPVQHGATTAVGNAQLVATLPAAAGKMTYIEGFDLDALGVTTAAAVDIVVGGLNGGNRTFKCCIGSGVTANAFGAGNHWSYRFPQPLPASAVNTAITVTVPALGSGNTDAAVAAYGYQK